MRLFQRYLPILLVVVLLATMFTIEATTAWHESQTIDEGVHLSAGFSYLKTGDFRLNPEHPPLIKELAALPLLFTPVKFPINDQTWQHWNQYQLGKVFLYHNVFSARTILFLGRLPIMLISLLLGWWIFRTSRELFGQWGGILSLSLYALDPGFIAHGHYVTTDVGFAAFSFWSVLRLRKMLDTPSRRNVILFITALWLAGMSKFSMIAYLMTLLIVVVILKFREPRLSSLQLRKWLKVTLISIPVLALLTWAFYGFDVRRRIDDPRVAELYAQRADYVQTHDVRTGSALVRFVMTKLGDRASGFGAWVDHSSTISVPGYAFFRGTIAVIGHSIGGQESYLHGQFKDTGWWYYFPTAMAIKTPLPTLAAILGMWIVVIVWIVRSKQRGKSWREVFASADRTWFIFLAIPTVFLLLSMGSHLNLGWRHIMPIYPFIFVLAGVFTSRQFLSTAKYFIIIPIVLSGGMLATQAKTYPNEIGYFNSLIGGSKNGPAWLIDSNLDWGQGVLRLADFMSINNIHSIPFVYYGWTDVTDYLNATHMPTSVEAHSGQIIHGYAAISIGQLYRRDGQYDWLKKYHPQELPGSGIYIYNLP